MSCRVLLAAVSALALVGIPPADAAPPRHRRTTMRTMPAPPRQAPVAAQPSTFYPQQVEGGVAGNLSFNNQIRKHTDPLNANGGR